MEKLNYSISNEEQGQRIDKYLSLMIEGKSRSFIQGLIDDKKVMANGKVIKSNYKLKNNDEVNILTFEDEKAVEVMRHSTSHVMAQAVKRVFKDVKLAIGPSIDNGFYYDFDIEEPLTTEDLNKIEKEINNIISEPLTFTR